MHSLGVNLGHSAVERAPGNGPYPASPCDVRSGLIPIGLDRAGPGSVTPVAIGNRYGQAMALNDHPTVSPPRLECGQFTVGNDRRMPPLISLCYRCLQPCESGERRGRMPERRRKMEEKQERFLTPAQAERLRVGASRAYDSMAARGSYDWVSAYHQAIDEATVRPGDARWCAGCESWVPARIEWHHGQIRTTEEHCSGSSYREGHCPKEAK